MTASNRELLEKAAKAAGIEGAYFHSDNPIHCGIYQARGEYYWNPLISDSEALRLAVKLRMSIDYREDGTVNAEIYHPTRMSTLVFEPLGDDPAAATRLAIVRAAAAMEGGSDA